VNTRSAYTRKKSLTNALPFVKYYCTCLLQDIIVLKVVCARINRPFILPARLHCPQCYSTIARLWGNIRPPLDLPFVCHTPYNIGNNNIVLRPTNATPAHTAPLLMVVSRCRGIGPPSGIPSSGLCFCWLPNSSASNTRPPVPSFLCCVGVACPARGFCHSPRRFIACFY